MWAAVMMVRRVRAGCSRKACPSCQTAACALQASPVRTVQWDAALALPSVCACVVVVHEQQQRGKTISRLSCLALIVYCAGKWQWHLACVMCMAAGSRACSEHTHCSIYG